MGFNITSRLKKVVQFDIAKNVIEIVELNKEFLAELLRTQLERGLDGNGNQVTIRGNTSYQPYTVNEKRKNPPGLGQVVQWITNYDTGLFYSMVTPHTNGHSLWFDSNVPYFRDIIAQSGPIIMKLNKTNLELFLKSKLRPALIRRMKYGI